VIASGKITTFPGKSAYQIIVEAMEPAGRRRADGVAEARRVKLAAKGCSTPRASNCRPYLPR